MRPLVAALVACSLALLAAACGGGDDDSDANPNTLLGEAAAKKIESAEVRLRMDADVPGFPILGSKISIVGSGPFVANGPDALPEFDWNVTLRAGGQTFPARVNGLDGNVYVEFMGQFYEADPKMLERLGLEKSSGGPKATSLKELGLDPDEWLTRVEVSDGEDIGGDSTRVVTGTVVEREVLENLLSIVDLDALTAAAGQEGEGLPDLEGENGDEIVDAIDSAKVEVNVDDEGYPRRVYAKLRFTMPKSVKDTAIESGTVTFDLTLEEVGGVTVDAAPPFDPKPLSSLLDFVQTIFGIDEPSDLWRKPN